MVTVQHYTWGAPHPVSKPALGSNSEFSEFIPDAEVDSVAPSSSQGQSVSRGHLSGAARHGRAGKMQVTSHEGRAKGRGVWKGTQRPQAQEPRPSSLDFLR